MDARRADVCKTLHCRHGWVQTQPCTVCSWRFSPRVQGTARSIVRQFGPQPARKDILKDDHILRFDTRCYIQVASAYCPEWRSRAPRPEGGCGRALPRGTMPAMPLETTGRAPEPGSCARQRRARPVSAHRGDGPMAPTTMTTTTRAKAGNATTSGLTRKHAVTCFPSPPSAGVKGGSGKQVSDGPEPCRNAA